MYSHFYAISSGEGRLVFAHCFYLQILLYKGCCLYGMANFCLELSKEQIRVSGIYFCKHGRLPCDLDLKWSQATF